MRLWRRKREILDDAHMRASDSQRAFLEVLIDIRDVLGDIAEAVVTFKDEIVERGIPGRYKGVGGL